MSEILDSGARRQFSTGGVRDISDDKGDMSLLPFDIVSNLGKFYDRGFDDTKFDIRFVMECIDGYTKYNNDEFIYNLLACFIHTFYNNLETGIIEYSKLLQKGQIKYNRMNWNKGLPNHCFLDSGLRHCMKVFRGDTDEDHKRAVIWNFVGLLWTKIHHSDLDDIYYGDDFSSEKIDEYNKKWGFNKK